MLNKKIIENVVEKYDTTITNIAKEVDVTRSKLYTFINGKANDQIQFQLYKSYPKAFTKTRKKSVTAVKKKKEVFTGEDKDLKKATSTAAEDTNNKGTKFKTPTRFLRLKNLRCKKDCFFMKASVQDLEQVRPKCPVCENKMLTKEERKKLGLEF